MMIIVMHIMQITIITNMLIINICMCMYVYIYIYIYMQMFQLRVSNPRATADVHFDMPFASSNLPGPGAIFPD